MKKTTTYGYCRISRPTQNIERQERNIKERYPDAHISKEAYTGTKLAGRKELEKILRAVKAGDCIVFDSVSRMSRNATEGVELYERLYNMGVELVFLKESHINTAVYREAIGSQLSMVGNEIADEYIKATNKVLMMLAKRQVEIAFEQAQKEVDDLRQRTSEGMKTAKLNGKQIGLAKGTKLTTKKSIEKKAEILKHSRDFNGTLNDVDCMKLTRLSRNTFYKYKAELKAELKADQ